LNVIVACTPEDHAPKPKSRLIIPAISINSQNYIVIDANDAYLINLVNEQTNNVIFKNALIGIAVQ